MANACLSLEACLDEQYGKDAPGLRAFREIPESIVSLIQQTVGADKTAAPTKAVTPSEDISRTAPELQKAGAESSAIPPGSPIRTRAEAYQRLAEAAEYLLQTEPHSPAPYLVKKAIAWGNMTLDELLPELVRDERALQDTMKLLQIESRKQPASQPEK